MKITNPLGFRKQHISVVLHQLSAQENCDGEPYDQMVLAAGYIEHLESALTQIKQHIEYYNQGTYEQHECWKIANEAINLK